MASFPHLRIQLLNEHQIARTLGLSVATVRRWRLYGRGPRFIKVGASIRYEQQAFEQWLASRPSGGEGSQENHGE